MNKQIKKDIIKYLELYNNSLHEKNVELECLIEHVKGKLDYFEITSVHKDDLRNPSLNKPFTKKKNKFS